MSFQKSKSMKNVANNQHPKSFKKRNKSTNDVIGNQTLEEGDDENR